MLETDTPAPPSLTRDPAGRIFLGLARADAVDIVERLRETHADAMGRAYLVHLDLLAQRLGKRWDAKRDLVFDHLKTSFERKFPEPDWCIQLNDDCFLAVILTLGEHKGALSAAELWYSAGQFFVGDVSGAAPPLYEALADDVDRLRLVPIDLNSYFDRAEARPLRPPEKPEAGGGSAEAMRGPGLAAAMTSIHRPMQAPAAAMTSLARRIDAPAAAMTPMQGDAPSAPPLSPVMTPLRRPAAVHGTVVALGGRVLRVACAIEPVFEMKRLAMIGHRFEPVVSEAGTGFPVDERMLAMLDWGDREQIDLANIEQGLALMKLRSPDQRRMMMLIPAAFSTFASSRTRRRLAQRVTAAAHDMGLKVLFEIRYLGGVPPGRINEIASLLKPFCMTTMGHVAADARAITALKGCGLAGACLDFDGAAREDKALEAYLAPLCVQARSAAGACMIQGLDNLHQMAVARQAGVSHASIRTSAQMTSRT